MAVLPSVTELLDPLIWTKGSTSDSVILTISDAPLVGIITVSPTAPLPDMEVIAKFTFAVPS